MEAACEVSELNNTRHICQKIVVGCSLRLIAILINQSKTLLYLQEIHLGLYCGYVELIENAALLWYIENDAPAH